MKLVKQSYEILEQEIPVRKLDETTESYKNRYLETMYKHIERCGKTCYRAEHNITEDSYKRFVQRMIDSRHFSVLEHGVIYLKMNKSQDSENQTYITLGNIYQKNPYSKVKWDDMTVYITVSYRIIIENGWEDDLQFICEPTEFHERRHTVLLHSCIHCYKDLTRHRKMSFSIESTRYVNYSRTERFGEMKFVLPPWIKHITCETFDQSMVYYGFDDVNFPETMIEWKFINHLVDTESTYNLLTTKTDNHWQPQQAAEILPQCTAADVIMSGYSSDWEFIFLLRSKIGRTGAPHPLVEELMTPLMEEFKQKGYISKEFPLVKNNLYI